MTPRPRPVVGTVQHYAWGDERFIPDLLGRPADGRPWAELWLGTHPNGQAVLDDGSPLRDVTGELPYLLKVLAAAQPLSLQAHPTVEQAVEGHARGVFPDPHAKPELLCALTRFEAFCGLRPPEQTLDLLSELGLGHGRHADHGAGGAADAVADLVAEAGPGAALHALYRGEVDARPLVAACAGSDRPEARLVRRLEGMYPGDVSVAATLLLNHVVLEPGQALHLTAGNLHGYVEGAGIELMGASDNVVRGGLTVKHVDVDELLAVVDPTPLRDPVMSGTDGGRYPLPEAGCVLVRLDAGAEHRSTGHELAVALDGTTLYLPPGATWSPAATAFVVVPQVG